jgi:hypothetical protein
MEKARTEEDVFRDLSSRVAERYPDYVLIVRPASGGYAWKYSDSNWAIGVTQRLSENLKLEDFFLKAQEEEKDGNG